jgi:hypothetical protein
METKDIVNGLKQLGFNSGWVVTGEKITVWENTEPQPSLDDILAASKLWNKTVAEQELIDVAAKTTAEAKLAALGLTADDLKALGLGGN